MAYKLKQSGDYRQRRNYSMIKNSLELDDLLQILYKVLWIIVRTQNARCYEGYPNDFDIEELLTANVLLVDVRGDRKLSITVGDWSNSVY